MQQSQQEQESLQQMLTTCRELEELVQSRGWARLRDIANGQVRIRQQQVFATPLKSFDDALSQEFLKGEGVGIETIMRTPETLISDYKEQIEILREQQGASDDNE